MKPILGKLNNQWLLNLATNAVPYCSHVDAAVAYVTKKDHPFLVLCKKHRLVLTLYALLDDEGAIDPDVLEELLAWGPSQASPWLVKGNFHAKVIWWRGFGAYVGSANLTEKAWFSNIEAGIFYTEQELAEHGVGDALEGMFEYLAKNSHPVTEEVVAKLKRLRVARRDLAPQQSELRAEYDALLGHLSEHKGPVAVRPKGERKSTAARRFVEEWMQTLQLMRGLRNEFLSLNLRPVWVDGNAHPAVHFDQFLHAYYYTYVREAKFGSEGDEDDDDSGLAKVEASFQANRSKPAAALAGC